MEHIDEEGLLREQVEHLGENKFKGAIQPMLQNLTKEMEFFEREENKESMHKLLNLYNERHHPYQRYVVTTMFKTKAVRDTFLLCIYCFHLHDHMIILFLSAGSYTEKKT